MLKNDVSQEPGLRNRLQSDLKDAMRAGDHNARDVIRFILSAVKNAEIDVGRELTQIEEVALLRRQAKQRDDSIEQFQLGRRTDLVERERVQLTVLQRYLPPEISETDLAALVDEAIAETGATGPSDMGKLMAALTQRSAGRFDGRRLSLAAKQALAQLAN